MIVNLSEGAFVATVYVLIVWLLGCNVYLITTYMADKKTRENK